MNRPLSATRVAVWGIAALLLVAPASATAGDSSRTVTWPARTMGTYVHVAIVTPDSAAHATDARAALAVFFRVDSLMSNWTTTSEVARVNRDAASGATPVQSEVAGVIQRSLDVWRESDHTFDITVEPLIRAWGFLGGKPHVPEPEVAAEAYRHVGATKLEFDPAARTLHFKEPGVRIDLGGIAKGYAVDVAAETLKARGVTDALVDLTGNMMALGHPAGADGWRIGIRDPRDRMPYFARLTLRDEGISTSGKYEQFVAANGTTYGHIMDPRTGRPAQGLISVTLVANSAYTTDAWDTPLFVLGLADAKRKAKERNDIAAVLVEPGADGVDTVWVEEPLRDRFVLEPAARAFFRVKSF